MSQNKQRRDFYSGIPWVNLTPDQARGHPKGKLGPLLWAIVVYFLFMSGFKSYLALSYDAGLGIAALNGIWPLLAGVGLAMRVPWSIYMAVIAAGLTVWSLIQGFGSETSIIYLLETVVNLGILFYLIDGDRPNLIYRHRYRQYSAETGGDDG